MKYNFDKVTKRIQSEKWCESKKIFGTDDIIPMWVADMDFESPKPVIDAILERAKHGIFGYTYMPFSYYQSIMKWFKKRYDWYIE
jgi:cystathionine beta-lyase